MISSSCQYPVPPVLLQLKQIHGVSYGNTHQGTVTECDRGRAVHHMSMSPLLFLHTCCSGCIAETLVPATPHFFKMLHLWTAKERRACSLGNKTATCCLSAAPILGFEEGGSFWCRMRGPRISPQSQTIRWSWVRHIKKILALEYCSDLAQCSVKDETLVFNIPGYTWLL